MFHSVKPRQIADKLVHKMTEAARDEYNMLTESLTDQERDSIKDLVWSHVCNHYARRYRKQE